MSPHSQSEHRSLSTHNTTRISKRPLTVRRLIPFFVLLLLALVFGASTVSSSSQVVPTTHINSVVADQTVTLTGYNFPPHQTFTVRMNVMGTRGVGGYVVGSTSTGNSTSFTASYTVPPQLQGHYQISIRLDSPQGYYSYNWFYNNTTGYQPGPSIGYGGIPTISIVSVDEDNSVTFRTHNYPPNQFFRVTMGPMFTRGIGGFDAGSFDSGAGGSFEVTVPIPSELWGSRRISIRAQTGHTYPYNPFYSYNWFWNNTTSSVGPGGSPEPPPPPIYTGIPTFKICSVVRDDTVTILTNNFPPNQTFTVTMGPMFTRGIGGTVVGTLPSGNGGALNATFPIPDHLKGSYRISIRAETGHANPYFAYNWFYNNTANVCP